MHAIDNRLDRLQVDSLPTHGQLDFNTQDVDHSRIQHLQSLVKSISASSSSSFTPATRNQLIETLEQAQLSSHCSTCRQYSDQYDGTFATEDADEPTLEHELEWLLLGKAATQTYGLVLDSLIHHTIPISDEIWYWKDILGSYRYTALYSIQTSPLRLFEWSKSIAHEVQQRRGTFVVEGWGQFYDLVKTVVRERNILDVQRRIQTPLALVKKEARMKRGSLERAKMQNASGIGYLLSSAFSDEM